jgi:flagellar basal-body rod modification protein FlgD
MMTTMLPLAATSNAASSGTSTSTSSSTSTAVNTDENMFLQLLVAQLQNQDPTDPTDSTTFVTQLAQFQQLQQSTTSGADITAIRQDLDQLVANLGQTSTSNG